MFFLMSIAKMHKGKHFSSNFLLSTIVFQTDRSIPPRQQMRLKKNFHGIVSWKFYKCYCRKSVDAIGQALSRDGRSHRRVRRCRLAICRT